MAGVATNEHIQGKAKDPFAFDKSITEVSSVIERPVILIVSNLELVLNEFNELINHRLMLILVRN